MTGSENERLTSLKALACPHEDIAFLLRVLRRLETERGELKRKLTRYEQPVTGLFVEAGNQTKGVKVP